MNINHLHALFAALKLMPESPEKQLVREMAGMTFEALRAADMAAFQRELEVTRGPVLAPTPSDFLNELTAAPESTSVPDATGADTQHATIGYPDNFDNISLADGLDVLVNAGLQVMTAKGNVLPGLEDVIAWYELIVADAMERAVTRAGEQVAPLTLEEEEVLADAFITYRATAGANVALAYTVEAKIIDQLGA